MKSIKCLFFVFLPFLSIACTGDNSSNASNEKQAPLQLNENCSEFKKDSSLWKAIQDSNLTKLKSSLKNCASLNISLYDTTLHADQFVMLDLIWNQSDDADSIIYYLIDNGMDSVAKNLENGFATEAMWAGDTNLVRYAMSKGYPINGETVYRAIVQGAEGRLGSKIAKKWYHELLPLILNVDRIRQSENSDYSILHEFCSQMGGVLTYLSEEDQLFYFQDLIDRGYPINQKSGNMVELDYCDYGFPNQTELQKKFTDILIKAGADTSLVQFVYFEP